MIRGMNAVLMILVALMGVVQVGKQLDDMARALGGLVGIAIMIAPFYFARSGLLPNSDSASVRLAVIVNVTAVCLVGIAIAVVVSFARPGYLFTCASLIVWIVPFLVNLLALAKRGSQLRRQPAWHAVEPSLGHQEIPVPDDPDSAAVATPESASAQEPDAPTVVPARVGSSNYFARHWRGEFSLAISYWVNCILMSAACVALITLVGRMEKGDYSLRVVSSASLAVLLLLIVIWFWSVVGVWRSADRHVGRGGRSFWAGSAKLMVLLGALSMAGQLSQHVIPQMRELGLIAIGQDPIGRFEVKIAPNGQSVVVNGTLREGSSVEIQRILDAAPAAKVLVLNSNGGRLLEAQQLARAVRIRRLDTYVEGQCASACTFVFLAGKDRAATPNARIGFHQPSFAGFDAELKLAATNEMMKAYRIAGLPEPFVQHIGKTSSKDMWYPSRDELITANVITRVSLGSDAAISRLEIGSKQELLLIYKSIAVWQAMERRFPGAIDEALEKSWAAKERGGNDAEMMTAARSVLGAVFLKAIKTADDAVLDTFVRLMIDEMSAARAISGEACAKLLTSQLDISRTLPAELIERDKALLLDALTAPQRSNLKLPSVVQVDRVLQLAMVDLPKQHVMVVKNVKAYANQPTLLCDATKGFYRAVAALPPVERNIALRGLFQSDY